MHFVIVRKLPRTKYKKVHAYEIFWIYSLSLCLRFVCLVLFVILPGGVQYSDKAWCILKYTRATIFPDITNKLPGVITVLKCDREPILGPIPGKAAFQHHLGFSRSSQRKSHVMYAEEMCNITFNF